MGAGGMYSNQRKFEREDTSLPAHIVTAHGSADCAIINISMGGAKVRTTEELPPNGTLQLSIEQFGTFQGYGKWRSGNTMGIQFDEDAGMSPEVLMAMAMYR